MKVDKLQKLENDIIRIQDTIADNNKRLEVLQQRYTQVRNERIIEMINKAEISLDDMATVLKEFERKKSFKEAIDEIEYVIPEED